MQENKQKGRYTMKLSTRYALLLWLLLTVPVYANITIDGDFVHVETDGYAVKFERGVITHIHNKLTDETYTHPNPHGKNGWTGLLFNSLFWESENISTRRATLVSATPLSANEAELLYRQEGTDVLLSLAVDPLTDDLLINMEGVSGTPGVVGMQWGMGYLDIHNLSVIAPVDAGRIIDASTPQNYAQYFYPSTWEAQLAVVQGERGGFYVRNTDNTFQFKRFIYDQRDGGFALHFGTYNQAPFDTDTTGNTKRWRFNTYVGGWRVPVHAYRDWMEGAFEPRRLSTMPSWVEDITLVAICNPSLVGEPAKLAQLVDPAKTVLQVGRWWIGGEPAYPDYTPKPELRSFLEDAKQYGFRIMGYTVVHGMSPDHPLYPHFQQYQFRHTWTGELRGQCLDRSCAPPEYPIAHISPASAEWRNLFVSQLKAAWEEYPFDGFVLDASHTVINDANGLIDGLNSAQGMALLHQELTEAMPGVVLGGERLHEATFAFARGFTSRGPHNTEIEAHPISTFLFSPFVQAISYGLSPGHDPTFGDEVRRHAEIVDAIPMLGIVGRNTFRPENVDVHNILEVARGWQPHDGLDGDINGDGQVNIFDLTLVGQNFGVTLAHPEADLNGDGQVNVLDLILVSNFIGW